MDDLLDGIEELVKRASSVLLPDASDTAYGIAGLYVLEQYGSKPMWYAAYGAALAELADLPAPADMMSVAHAIATVVAPITPGLIQNGGEGIEISEQSLTTTAAFYAKGVAHDWRRQFNAAVPTAFTDAFG